MTQINGKISHVHGLEELILLNCPHPQSDLQVQCNPYQNCNGILHRNRKNNLKIHMEPQKTRNSQSNPEKEEQSLRHHTFWFQSILQSYSNQGTSLVVQWLRLHIPSAERPGSIPGQGTRSHMPQLRVRVPQLKIPHAATKDLVCHNEDPECRN